MKTKNILQKFILPALVEAVSLLVVSSPCCALDVFPFKQNEFLSTLLRQSASQRPQSQLEPNEASRSEQGDFLLRYEAEYPKIAVHGESRTRFHVSHETMDLGANVQPITRDVAVDTDLGGGLVFTNVFTNVVLDPIDTPAADVYRQIQDKFVDLRERFLGTLHVDFTRNISSDTTMRVDTFNLGGFKAPREDTLMSIHQRDFTRLEEVYLKALDLANIDGLTLRAGRQFLDFDFGFAYNDVEKEDSTDMAQMVYTANPWQFQMFYLHPVFDKLYQHFQFEKVFDNHGGYLRYKGDTLRYTFAYVGTNKNASAVAPITLFNQVLWDPVPRLETETAVCYQFGRIAMSTRDEHLSAVGLNLVAKYKVDLPLSPQIGCDFILGQGSAGDGQSKNFGPLNNSKEYGYIVESTLNNIYMIDPFLSLQVTKNSTLTFKHFYFAQYRTRADFISRNENDNGGIAIPTNGASSDVGHEFDAIHETNILDNLTSQIYAAWFLPGHAFGQNPNLPFPGTGWQKVPFKFRWQITFSF